MASGPILTLVKSTLFWAPRPQHCTLGRPGRVQEPVFGVKILLEIERHESREPHVDRKVGLSAVDLNDPGAGLGDFLHVHNASGGFDDQVELDFPDRKPPALFSSWATHWSIRRTSSADSHLGIITAVRPGMTIASRSSRSKSRLIRT